MPTNTESDITGGTAKRGALRLTNFSHDWGTRTLIMGIVNVTPDSFSGDGTMSSDDAVMRAARHIECGADIIDIGGESTRPGHHAVDAREESNRVVPVIAAIADKFPQIPLSLDTTKSEVLKAAPHAHILNSVWGISDELLQLAAERDLPIVIMHNKIKAEYFGDVMDEVLEFLDEHAEKALNAGVLQERIILDPGIGFGKTAEHSISVLHQLRRLVALGFPTLIGTSRKSFIGKITGKTVEDRVFGTAASLALAIAAGIDIVRVHDVAAAKDVVAVSDAIVRGWQS